MIQELPAAVALQISGGDDFERLFGLMYGLGIVAGAIGSGGLLAAAFAVGAYLVFVE